MASSATNSPYLKPFGYFSSFEWENELTCNQQFLPLAYKISFHQVKTPPVDGDKHQSYLLNVCAAYNKYGLAYGGVPFYVIYFKCLEGSGQPISVEYDLIIHKKKNPDHVYCHVRGKSGEFPEGQEIFRNYPCFGPNEPTAFGLFQTQAQAQAGIGQANRLKDEDLANGTRLTTVLYLSVHSTMQSLAPTLELTMQNLFLSDDMSDVKIICDGQEFPAHKFILSARSDVFKAMFSSELQRNRESMEVDGISADTMKKFLKFIYRDEVKAKDIDSNLLIAADRYNVKRLVDICINHMESTIDAKNVMQIVFTAHLINNDQLLRKASHFIFTNPGKVKKSERWEQMKKNPLYIQQIATKVMESIVFDQQSWNVLKYKPLLFNT